jgi:imidazolonepropionase-like amidohydrolase
MRPAGNRHTAASLALAAGVALGAAAGGIEAAPLVVKAGTLYTMAGEPIADGVVVVEDGRIVAVGPAAGTPTPPGAEVFEAAVVTPGLIDAHCVVGLAGYLNQPHDQDQLERSSPVQPELRAIDAYDARERLVEWVRGFGVTTIHTGHGPGALVSGQTLVAKTRGGTVEQAVVVPVAMIAATLGESAVVEEKGKAPGTRGKLAAILRADLVKAAEYQAKRKRAKPGEPVPRDLRLEALGRVLDRELPLLVTAQRHQDIMTALRLQREFGFRLVLDGAADAHLLVDEIKAAGVPVIVHPTMARAVGETENLSMETAARLADAGIPIALQSGFESYVPKTRVVLFEAAVAAARGLGPERALRTVTIDAARLLGIDDRVGSLEVGKDGDLALYDGDPFEYTSHCERVVIGGEVFPGESTRQYEVEGD